MMLNSVFIDQTTMYTIQEIHALQKPRRRPSSTLYALKPSEAHSIYQWTGSPLVQVMACHLLGTKPLPKPMLIYCQLEPKD